MTKQEDGTYKWEKTEIKSVGADSKIPLSVATRVFLFFLPRYPTLHSESWR